MLLLFCLFGFGVGVIGVVILTFTFIVVGGRGWLRCECGSCPQANPNLEAVM